MCEVCKQVKGLAAVDALQVIGAAMKGRAKSEQEHLLDLADSISAPYAEEESDDELATEWERQYRGGR
jgi:hypothetical protein